MQAVASENQQLKGRISRLQSDCDAIQIAYDNLKLQAAETAEWANQMADRFGPSVWYFGSDEKPLPYKSIKNATPQHLLEQLNQLFREAKLPLVDLKKIDGDTAYIRVVEDEQLTQNMGTTGATAYIQVVTYTFVSLPDIDYVDFEFPEGDHAIPGKYSR